MLAQNRFHLPPSFLADTSHTPLNVPRNESESEMDKTCRSIVLLLQWTQAVIASTPAIFIKHGVWVWAVDTISLNIFLPILKSKSFKSEKVLLLPRNKYKYVNYGLVLNFLLSLQPSCILKSLFGSLKLRSPPSGWLQSAPSGCHGVDVEEIKIVTKLYFSVETDKNLKLWQFCSVWEDRAPVPFFCWDCKTHDTAHVPAHVSMKCWKSL